MKLHSWETTIQQITDESDREAKESGKQRVLKEWRSRLLKEPHLLQPFQIDEIVRAVRKRLKVTPPPVPTGLHARPNTAAAKV